MHYGKTTLGTGFRESDLNNWKVKLIYYLLFFIPKANPDNEKLYPKVSEWLLELNEKNEPIREIGLDESAKTLFVAPDDRNTGFWTDIPERLEEEDLIAISKEYFDKKWSEKNA